MNIIPRSFACVNGEFELLSSLWGDESPNIVDKYVDKHTKRSETESYPQKSAEIRASVDCFVSSGIKSAEQNTIQPTNQEQFGR